MNEFERDANDMRIAVFDSINERGPMLSPTLLGLFISAAEIAHQNGIGEDEFMLMVSSAWETNMLLQTKVLKQ